MVAETSDRTSATLSEADLCLIATNSLAESGKDREVGTDETISILVAMYLAKLGLDPDEWSWHLGSGGDWFMEDVAAFTDRLATLNWATADSPYRLTPAGQANCKKLLDELLAGPCSDLVQQLVTTRD